MYTNSHWFMSQLEPVIALYKWHIYPSTLNINYKFLQRVNFQEKKNNQFIKFFPSCKWNEFLILYKINKILIITYIINYLVKKVFIGNLVATIVQELSPQCFIFHFVRGKIFWREKKKPWVTSLSWAVTFQLLV